MGLPGSRPRAANSTLCNRRVSPLGAEPLTASTRASASVALVAIAGGGLFNFYFRAATPDGWMALSAGINRRRRAILAMG